MDLILFFRLFVLRKKQKEARKKRKMNNQHLSRNNFIERNTFMKNSSLPLFHRSTVIKATVVSAIALAVYLWPEVIASESQKALVKSLDDVSKLSMGPVAKTGLSVTTIIGTIAAAAKHSVGMAAIVMGMGVALSYYLSYLQAWN
jgi:hypothetical protein